MMMRFATFALLLLAVPTIAFGSSVLRTGDNISIATDQAVEGDFYGLANDTTISGEITEDLLVAAAKVTINGKVGSDLAALASIVNIAGLVGDDARVIAGEVTVAGEIKGDLVVVASSLKVLSTAKIGGDIIFFGSQADISGVVGKWILGSSDKVRIDGTVLGDVDIKTGSLTLGDRADVTGMVRYMSATELVRAQNSVVAGKVLKNEPPVVGDGGFKGVFVSLLVSLFAVLVWFLFFRRMLEKVVSLSNNNPLRNIFIGFGVFFLVPIATIILVMSTLGLLLGITLIFFYCALLLISFTLMSVIAGAFVARTLSKPDLVSIRFIIVGSVLTSAALYVPVIGLLLLIILLFLTLGAVTVYLYRLVKSS